MSAIITLDQAQIQLKDLVRQLGPGDELVITENERPVAKLVGEGIKGQKGPRPGPGLLRGSVTYMAPDFDEPLEDMREYME
ncbi:MAG TPA: hypothetical protein VHR66_18795 [Gemmataceae bacterium]|jgi:antitoxin (DNA-binding transcriptional repressor) of toxin-antitoxin stability system|nr:hypothetical protein [Gemmataceae bacterium]